MHDRALGPATPAFPRSVLGNRVFAGAFPAALLRGADDHVPRALMDPRVRAAAGDPDPKKILMDLTSAFDDFRERHGGDIKALQAAADDMAVKMAALQMGAGGVVMAGQAADPEYTRHFSAFFRHAKGEHELKAMQSVGDRARVQASMTVGSPTDGGYLAPAEWDRTITSTLRSLSSMRQVAKVVPTSVGAFSTVYNQHGFGSGWVGETASRPQTTTAPLAQIAFKAGELYANPAVSQTLLDDSAVDLAEWIATEVADEFSVQEGISFLSGNGQNKPQGLLTYTDPTLHPGGAIGVTLSGAAGSITADSIIDLVFGLPAPYRQNARFMMNSATIGGLRKLKDGQGNYLWQPSYVAGSPSTLAGYPIAVDEHMPDVTAGALPVAFGDFGRGYLINDRMGVRVLRDPYVSKPFVSFYTTKRVGGGVLDIKAVRLLKVGTA